MQWTLFLNNVNWIIRIFVKPNPTHNHDTITCWHDIQTTHLIINKLRIEIQILVPCHCYYSNWMLDRFSFYLFYQCFSSQHEMHPAGSKWPQPFWIFLQAFTVFSFFKMLVTEYYGKICTASTSAWNWFMFPSFLRQLHHSF